MPKSLITIRPNTAIHGNLRRLQTEPNDIEDQNLERELEKKSEAVRKNQFGLLVKHQKLLNAAKKNERDIDILASYKFNENDANITDESGNTPLFYAARWGNKELCEYLLGLKARCNQRCQDGNTPLHMAFASNKVMVYIYFQVLFIDCYINDSAWRKP